MNKMMRFPPPPIAFTAEQRSGITKEDLEDGKLNVFINPYFEGEEGDRIELWIGTSQAESSGSYLHPAFTVEDPSARTAVYFTADHLRAVNDLKAYFGYRVNGNDLSQLVGIDVALTAKRLVV